MPRTNLACSICVHDDASYLAETIRSVGGVVPVFVFVSRVAWHAEPGDWEQTVRIAEAAGAEVVVGEWGDAETHREAARAWLVARRFTHAIALDSDEVLDGSLRDTLVKLARSGLAECVMVEMDTYWNSPEYVVRPRAQRHSAILLDLRVTRATGLRGFEGGRVLHLSADYGVVHHLSYVGPDERVARKMRTSSRRFEWQPFWWEQVWQGWKEDRLLRDLHPTHPQVYGFAERIPVPAVLEGVYQQWLSLTRNPDRQAGLREGAATRSREAPLSPEEQPAAKRRSTRKRKPAGAKLSIVIPLHGGPAEIRQCLESLERSRDLIHEVVVVDDASPDDAPAEVEKFPWPKLVRQEVQQGFAATCNRGLAESSGELVLFLNSDTVVPRSGLQQLLEAIGRDPQIGAAGPYTNHAAYGQAIPCTYTTLDTLDLFAEDFAERPSADVDTDMLVGFCLLVQRQVLDAVGLFDTQFGLGTFEDNDLCYRMRRAGYRLVLAARSFVHHHGSRSMRTAMDVQAQKQKNGRLFYEKWRGDLQSGFASHLSGTRSEPIRFDPTRDPDQHPGMQRAEQAGEASPSTFASRAAPGTVSAFIEGFEAALKNREWSTAEGYLGAVRDAEGCSITWTQMAVRLAAAAGDDPDRFLARCLDTAPGEVGPRLILARRLLQRGREAEAEPHLLQLQQQGVAEAAYYLGIFALRCGERHAALGWMERARELNPGHAPTQEQIATLQRELGYAGVQSAPVV